MTSPDELLHQLHEAARGARGPSDEVRSKILQGVASRLNDGSTIVEPETGGSSGSPLSMTGVKVLVPLIIVGVVLVALRSGPERVPPDPSAGEDVSVGTPVVVAQPADQTESQVDTQPHPPPSAVVETESSPVVRHSRKRPVSTLPTLERHSNSEPGEDATAEEIALVAKISRAMTTGNMAEVLKLVADHEARFRSGIFEEEREAAKVRANCRLGKRERGSALVAQFEVEWPDSMQLNAVRHDCAATDEP